MQFLVDEKGKRRLLYDGYLFYHDKSNMGTSYWKCENFKEKCLSRVILVDEKLKISPKDHNHPANPVNVEKQKYLIRIKNAAATTTTSTHRIISENVGSISESVAAALPSMSSQKRLLRNVRNKKTRDPPIPELFAKLHFPDDLQHTEKGKQFLYYDSGENDRERIVIFTTKKNLKLLSKYKHWFADGTFDACPSPFYQLYSIHALVEGVLIPLVYVLLPNKHQNTYLRFLVELNELYEPFSPESLMMDMEIAFSNAFQEVFPNVKVRFCFFHFCQAVYRNVGKYGLKTRYDTDESICMKIKLLMSLAFVPTNDVVPLYDTLLRTEFRENDDNIDTFLMYFEKRYIGAFLGPRKRKQPKIAIESWNHYEAVQEDLPKTNNGVEGWHRGFNELLSRKSSTIWHVVHSLKLEQSRNEMTISQIKSAVSLPPPKKKYVRLGEQLKATVSRYDRPIFQNKVDYLYSVARLISF